MGPLEIEEARFRTPPFNNFVSDSPLSRAVLGEMKDAKVHTVPSSLGSNLSIHFEARGWHVLSLSFPGLILEYWRTPLRQRLIFQRKQTDTFVRSSMLKTLVMSPRLGCLTLERGV